MDVYSVHQHREFLGNVPETPKICLAIGATIDHQDVFGRSNIYKNWYNVKTKWTVLFTSRC